MHYANPLNTVHRMFVIVSNSCHLEFQAIKLFHNKRLPVKTVTFFLLKIQITIASEGTFKGAICGKKPRFQSDSFGWLQVGILLRAYGYSWDTIIYVSGGEVFGGQRTLIPLRAMFENVVDRTSLSTPWELSKLYGCEANLVDTH